MDDKVIPFKQKMNLGLTKIAKLRRISVDKSQMFEVRAMAALRAGPNSLKKNKKRIEP